MRVLKRVYLWYKRKKCRHKSRKEIFRCYQDRYVEEKCEKCNILIYSDL